MPIYDYACDCGNRFEALVPSSDSVVPDCMCGARPRRLPPGVRLGGVTEIGPSRDDAPKSWRGTGNGDRDTIRHWHQQMTRREKLEQKYPELAGDRRPVLAHEGRFAGAPLRAGDPIPDGTPS
ncbi:FmdB family zinc ribbon protein [Nocardia salmonicida]|uniref:FmdB family zinc ribbon protein n=1 Tax=Nocardia salmonicida TaxID=53431 RepID=UPI0033EA7A84